MIGFSTFKTFGSNADFIVIFENLIGPICIVVIGLDSTNSEKFTVSVHLFRLAKANHLISFSEKRTVRIPPFLPLVNDKILMISNRAKKPNKQNYNEGNRKISSP